MDYVTISENMRLYSTGSIIAKEGDTDHEMFVLNKGMLGVFKGEEMITYTISDK